jgi:phosphoglycerol transferase MdoB-like AlkP superfamily enzyme
MEIFKFFDAYSIRARLFPAIIAAAPSFAALTLLISWKSFGLSNLIATLGILVLLFAIADFARARGRAIEDKLYAERGGIPSITMFRRNDGTINGGSKDRYRAFLASKLAVTAPSPAEESADQAAADSFYGQCGNWLRQNTRDAKRFPILFGENITYGFRRNLLGVKVLALFLNAMVVTICTLILWRPMWDADTPQGSRIAVVLVVAAAHAAYMLLAVTRTAVWDASKAYGRELILSCESFLAQSRSPARKTAARKSASKTEHTSPPPGQS